MTLIPLDGVARSYRLPEGHTVEAVRPTTLEMERGTVYALVGKSGADLYTLLRLTKLPERPDRGRVFVGGRGLTALSKRELREARQGIGMSFHDSERDLVCRRAGDGADDEILLIQ